MVRLRFIGERLIRLLELSKRDNNKTFVPMQGQIQVKDKKINYQIKNSSRAKKIRLAVYLDGSVVATKPRGVSIFFVERFIKQKVNWILNKINAFDDLNITLPKATKEDYLANKSRAVELVNTKISELNRIYNFQVNKVNVRNQRTRWGSCSSKYNLSFNYRVIYLSDRLVKYIVVHELCHLKELNHSKSFWKLVEKAVPDYISIRKELKDTK
jgi:predicted metal-dependent hydrolase